MKIKKIIMLALCVAICTSICITASAVTNSLYEVKKITSFSQFGNDVPEGMCVDRSTNICYTAKKTENDAKCIIIKTDLNNNKSTVMVNSATGSKKVSYLSHANDMTFVDDGTKKYLYVATCCGRVDVGYDIVKLEVTGNKFKRVARYKVKYAGKRVKLSGIAFAGKSGDDLTFLVKKGNKIYTLVMPSDASTGTVKLTKKRYLNLSSYSGYIAQNIACTNYSILVTYFKAPNKNVIIEYDMEDYLLGKSTTINPLNAFNPKKDIESYYSVFEVEAVDFRPDGTLCLAVDARVNRKTDVDRLLGYSDYAFNLD